MGEGGWDRGERVGREEIAAREARIEVRGWGREAGIEVRSWGREAGIEVRGWEGRL